MLIKHKDFNALLWPRKNKNKSSVKNTGNYDTKPKLNEIVNNNAPQSVALFTTEHNQKSKEQATRQPKGNLGINLMLLYWKQNTVPLMCKNYLDLKLSFKVAKRKNLKL